MSQCGTLHPLALLIVLYVEKHKDLISHVLIIVSLSPKLELTNFRKIITWISLPTA
eukprot:c41385_g1_i1 orf=31-198(-)